MVKKIKITLLLEFLRGFGAIFSLAILAMTIAGMLIGLFGQEMSDVSTLFALGSGLPYSTILQIAGFALIIAFFSVLLFSEHLQIKVRFLIRGLLLLLVTLITTSILAIVFNWFPPGSTQAWIGFVFCTIFCFTISFALTLVKIKLEGKKYSKLLADYKARHNSPAL
jgi:hypothetical protein